jgi:acetate kinase
VDNPSIPPWDSPPQSGLPQTRRTGDLDPVVLLWLIEEGKATPQELNTILNTQSGLVFTGGIGEKGQLYAAAS